jgi:acetyl esterase/lipase
MAAAGGSAAALGRAAFDGATPSPFERLAQWGLAVGSVGYRLSGEARWPANSTTSRRPSLAAGPCRRGGHRCGPDGAWGESAGGHLAALLGLTGADMDGEIRLLGPPTEVETVVA